jgi:hypothetical protein
MLGDSVRSWPLVLGLSGAGVVAAGCNGDDGDAKDHTGVVADADADADADTDSDADADTDADVDVGTSVRVVHAASGLLAQDMAVNGTLPPVLQDLRWEESTAYSPRPPGSYTFQFVDAGADIGTAWTSFVWSLVGGRRHTLVVAGAPGDSTVLRWVDSDLDVPTAEVRIRWTHVAPQYPGPIDVLETLSGTVLASDIEYLGSVELDHPVVPMQVGIDIDDDGVADLVFQQFTREAGEYFHVMFANEVDGTAFLLGQTADGTAPRRDQL